MTPKQQRFVEEFQIDRNATQAAIRAGYSERSAMQIGEHNMRKHEIAAAIKAQDAKLSEKTQTTLETLTAALWDTYQDNAAEDGNQSARVSSLMGLAKMHGLEADPRKNNLDPVSVTINGFPDLKKKLNGHANGHAPYHDSE